MNEDTFLIALVTSIFIVALAVVLIFVNYHITDQHAIESCVNHGMQWVKGSCVKR